MNNCDVAIVGAGPAGLAAAAHLVGTGLSTQLIAPKIGGRLSYTFQLRGQKPVDTVHGADLARYFEDVVNEQVETLQEETLHVVQQEQHFVLTLQSGKQVRARAVIIASGARSQRLYIPGEKEFFGRGLSYSAISHAPLFHGRRVAVVGYGERALVALLGLAEVAEHVYFVPTVALDRNDERRVQIENNAAITILYDRQVIHVDGDDFVDSVRTLTGEGGIINLDVEGVFIEMDLLRNNSMVRELVDVDPQTGAIPIDQRCATSVPGLFAAGDITNIHAEQVPIAIGEGLKAAISAWRYLVTATDEIHSDEVSARALHAAA